MQTVGIFAGRGDVVVAFGFAILIGFWLGWKFRSIKQWINDRRGVKQTNA